MSSTLSEIAVVSTHAVLSDGPAASQPSGSDFLAAAGLVRGRRPCRPCIQDLFGCCASSLPASSILSFRGRVAMCHIITSEVVSPVCSHVRDRSRSHRHAPGVASLSFVGYASKPSIKMASAKTKKLHGQAQHYITTKNKTKKAKNDNNNSKTCYIQHFITW